MSVPQDWWRTFFSGGMVEFWLRATTEEQTQQEADFLQGILQVAPKARLLDVPCGGGRHSLALAARGYQMTGVDFSPAFLAAARAAERSLEVRWEQREMRDLPWREEFDGAFSFGNSFGYLDDDGNADFVKAVAHVLKPGARFVLDVNYLTEGILPVLQERTWYPLGNDQLLAERRYDPSDGRLYVKYIWVCDGRSETRSMSARLYTYRELVRLLEQAGFSEVQGFSSLTKEPFTFGSRRLLMMGTKKPV